VPGNATARKINPYTWKKILSIPGPFRGDRLPEDQRDFDLESSRDKGFQSVVNSVTKIHVSGYRLRRCAFRVNGLRG